MAAAEEVAIVAIVVIIVAIVVAGPFVGPIGAQLMSRPGTYDHCIYSGFLQSVLLNEGVVH